MISSIRRFLLVYILIAIAVITSLSAVGDYYLSREDIRSHMDALLEQMGLSFAVIIANNINSNDIQELESELSLIQNQNQYLFYLNDPRSQNAFFNQGKYYFQLWDDRGKLLLYSVKANHLNLDVTPIGFSDREINGEDWRVFKIHDNKRHINFIVGEKYNIRNQLLHRIALNNFYVMLLTYPLSGILIWFIVGWGFKSLRRITNEVSNRAPSYLEPVDSLNAPIEIKPLIDELNHLFARLREAFEREKRFAADAAHELRTPLAALKTQAQIVLKISDESEKRLLLENLITSVDRIVHIVQQLLTLSRLVPEAASIYDIVDMNLPKLTAEIIAQLVPMALEKEIDIELEAPQSNLTIKGNLTGISILIRNLVDNAIRYTPEKGQVKVEIQEEEKTIVLRVSDSGPGIPEDLRARVFERFYRVIGSNVSGSGLGLSIVQQIAELHHAEITLGISHLGKGLKFEVRFSR